jgi:hypothetical protein
MWPPLATELLERSAMPEGRTALEEATGIPVDVLLRMVYYCDLCRVTGMAGRSLRRAVGMGYDRLESFRATTAERIEAEFDTFLETSGERANRMVSFTSFIH